MFFKVQITNKGKPKAKASHSMVNEKKKISTLLSPFNNRVVCLKERLNQEKKKFYFWIMTFIAGEGYVIK